MREKLIELLQSAPADIMGNHGVGALADHLIANGVTLDNQVSSSKWIPVTERLPDGECLAISMKPGSAYKEQWIGYIGYDEIADEYVCETDGVCLHRVTHWMPLPEPPKGE